MAFDIPDAPWSTNDDRRMHPLERHGRIQRWKEATAWYVKKYRIGPVPSKIVVHVRIPFGSKRKRDPHNYCGTVVKAVVDGLVLAGVVPDDTPEWVGHREPTLAVGGPVVVTFWKEEDDACGTVRNV